MGGRLTQEIDLYTGKYSTCIKKKGFICAFIYNNKPVIKMEGRRKI